MKKKISINSELKNVRPIVEEILKLLKKNNVGDSHIFDIRLSLEESLINAIKYGNRFDRDLKVDIEYQLDADKIIIDIADKGKGFDHKAVPDPTNSENLLIPRGRGVYLIKHLMDKVEYNNKGNRVTMEKRFKKASSVTKKGR